MGMLQLPHHRPFYSVSGRRADRRYLWNRWRSDYRSFHCLIFSPSHPYDCRRDFDGNMRNFNRGSNLLSIDRTIFCYRGRGCFAGLAARVSLWHRWIRRDVSGSWNPKYVPAAIIGPALAILITIVGLQYVIGYFL